MLTTTLDGLWALQVLSGIEALAPELGLRPILPSAEPREVALVHPIVAELQGIGAVSDDGEVDPAIVEWLTVLARRDIGLLMYVTTPSDPATVGVLLARFAQWWVVIERAEDVVRIGPAGTATAEGAANAVVKSQIERLLGPSAPVAMRPATIDATSIVSQVKDRDGLQGFLNQQRLDSDQIRTLMLATDTTRSASASIVAVQSGVESAIGRVHVEHGSVTIYDTPDGRVLIEHSPQGEKNWMIASPGSASNIATAVNAMVRRLPAKDEWFSYRRIV